ncbi:hypothetical protein DFH06DRAFT_1193632 [Mycena polygramma]|nr:hypothetical protein DFH06DRAFT_1193632 [Mycena polygramma]
MGTPHPMPWNQDLSSSLNGLILKSARPAGTPGEMLRQNLRGYHHTWLERERAGERVDWSISLPGYAPTTRGGSTVWREGMTRPAKLGYPSRSAQCGPSRVDLRVLRSSLEVPAKQSPQAVLRNPHGRRHIRRSFRAVQNVLSYASCMGAPDGTEPVGHVQSISRPDLSFSCSANQISPSSADATISPFRAV